MEPILLQSASPFSPQRNPVSPRGRRTTGYCASGNGEAQPFESLLERRLLVVLLACPYVRTVISQGVTLALSGDGGPPSRYTADVVADTHRGVYLCEAKYAKDFDCPETQARLARADTEARARGFRGLLRLDERVIDRQPRLENAFVIKRYRNFPVNRSLELALANSVIHKPGISVAELQLECGPGKRAAVYALLARRVLVADINVSFNAAAPLWHCSNHPNLENSYADHFCW